MLTIKDNCNKHTENADTEKPTIKLNGSSTIIINLNDEFTDPGATAQDNKDGDLSNKIVVTGKVDTSKAGKYVLTYTVEDSAKNKATVTRTVIVKDSNSGEGENKTPEQNNQAGSNTTVDGNNTVDGTT